MVGVSFLSWGFLLPSTHSLMPDSDAPTAMDASSANYSHRSSSPPGLGCKGKVNAAALHPEYCTQADSVSGGHTLIGYS